jgi:hypothetical protein
VLLVFIIIHRMILCLSKPVWRNLRRRICSGVTLLAYLAAAIGFPLPQTFARQSNACGRQVCGCDSAEQCKARGCCSQGTPQAPPEESEPGDCCSKKKPVASCCTEKKPAAEEPTQPQTKPKEGKVRWVIGMSAKKCHGGGTEWLNGDAAGLPMSLPTSWQPSWPYCHSVPILHEYSHVLSVDHLDPPPRLEAV